MKVVIGADENGIELAYALQSELKILGYYVETIIVQQGEAYPHVATRVCRHVQFEKESIGILVCGTGIGMSIVANKFKGIYAMVLSDDYSLIRSVISNDVNMLCLGQSVIGKERAVNMTRQWLRYREQEKVKEDSKYKLDIIHEIEKENFAHSVASLG